MVSADPSSPKLPDAAFGFAGVNCRNKFLIFEGEEVWREPPVTRDWKGRFGGRLCCAALFKIAYQQS